MLESVGVLKTMQHVTWICSSLGRDLKYNVGNVETGEKDVVVVALQSEILLETGKFGISDVCSLKKGKCTIGESIRSGSCVDLKQKTLTSMKQKR